MKKYIISSGLVMFAPLVAFAADASSILTLVSNLISTAVPIVISATVLWFLWNLFKYMQGDKKDEAKDSMIWGIIILFVMVSIWGLVNLLSDTLDLNTNINVTNPVNVIKN